MAGVPVGHVSTVAFATGTDVGVRPYTCLFWSRATRRPQLKLIQSCLVVRCAGWGNHSVDSVGFIVRASGEKQRRG
jgi:hypothetical protein